MYSLFVLLTLLTIYFLIIALSDRRTIYFVLFSICSVLNLYSHYHSIIVTISCFIYVLLISDKSLYKPLSLCFCFIFIAYSFWLSSFYEHFFEYSNLGGKETSRLPTKFGSWVKPIYLVYCFSIGQSILPWQWLISIPLGIIIGIAIYVAFKHIIKKKNNYFALFHFLFFLFFLGSFFQT